MITVVIIDVENLCLIISFPINYQRCRLYTPLHSSVGPEGVTLTCSEHSIEESERNEHSIEESVRNNLQRANKLETKENGPHLLTYCISTTRSAWSSTDNT